MHARFLVENILSFMVPDELLFQKNTGMYYDGHQVLVTFNRLKKKKKNTEARMHTTKHYLQEA